MDARARGCYDRLKLTSSKLSKKNPAISGGIGARGLSAHLFARSERPNA